MKNKLIVIGISLFVLIGASIATPISQGEQYRRIHQHKMQQPPNLCEVHDDSTFCTHLPIVKINTHNQTIPGVPILNEDDIVIDYTLGDKGEEMVTVEVEVIDEVDGIQHLADEPKLSSQSLFRVRGNSSRKFDKKSYLLRLIDEKNKENKQEMMGMTAHDEWALYGPFLDKTLMRNYMWLNIVGDITGYAPNVRFCEVFLDEKYQGVYLMMETVARSEGRVNLTKYSPGDREASYIIKLDQHREEDIRHIDDFLQYTLNYEMHSGISVIYPPKKHLTPELKDKIEKDISQFEKTLYSYDFKDPKKGYRAYIDVDSFVDYYILCEFLMIEDMCSRSTYLSKDIRGKLTMSPMWDFNNVLDNYFIQLSADGEGIFYNERTWFKMLLKDEYFVDKVVRRYHALRESHLKEAYLLEYIDEVSQYLGKAVERNYSVWGYSFLPEHQTVYNSRQPQALNPSSYEEAVQQMKEMIIKRGRWLDENIETLYQYCHESKIKPFIQ